MEWSRFLNLVYYFITRNADEDKKKEIDAEISRIETALAMETKALTSRNALRATQNAEKRATVPQGTPETPAGRRKNLPPPPAGWGDAGASLNEAMSIHKTLSRRGKRR